jgi:hypothetical protein
MGGNCQNHVNNIVLFGCNCHCLFPKHGLTYVFMKAIINFMFKKFADEAMINDGTKFLYCSTTSFVTRFISCIIKLCWSSIHYYLLLFLSLLFGLFKFQWQHSLECLGLLHWSQITYVPLPLLTFFCFIGGFNNFGYSLVFPMFSSHMITSFLVFEQDVLLHPQYYGYMEIWL